jgi:hypothetical protein
MVVSEGQRRALHERLVEVLGVDQADLLMEHLPPSGWGDVARRSDLDHLEHVLRAEMTGAIGELRGEMSELRGEMSELRGEMSELRGDLMAEMARQTRTVIVAMASMVVAVVGSLAVALITMHA